MGFLDFLSFKKRTLSEKILRSIRVTFKKQVFIAFFPDVEKTREVEFYSILQSFNLNLKLDTLNSISQLTY